MDFYLYKLKPQSPQVSARIRSRFQHLFFRPRGSRPQPNHPTSSVEVFESVEDAFGYASAVNKNKNYAIHIYKVNLAPYALLECEALPRYKNLFLNAKKGEPVPYYRLINKYTIFGLEPINLDVLAYANV